MNLRLKKLKKLAELYKKQQLGCLYTSSEIESANTVCELDADINELSKAIKRCHLCDLAKTRRHALTAFGCGDSGIMIVVDSPNANENELGAYYHGKTGTLLKNMIEKGMNLSTDNIFLTSAIKCHTANQSIRSDYIPYCKPYLVAEIKALKPKVILSLGQIAFEALTGLTDSILQVRGKQHQIVVDGEKFTIIPSFAPSYLELNPKKKKDAFNDLKEVLRIAGR